MRRLTVLANLLLLAAIVAPASAAKRGVAVEENAAAAYVAEQYGTSWAVVIGINDYQHQRVPKLQYAVNDAVAVERALLGRGFRQEHIIKLLDREATKSRIETVLGDDLRSQVGQNDRVLVFFAGHGKTDRLRSGDEEGYLIPVDGDPAKLFSTAVSMTALRQISDRLPAKHILYVVDSCYSGYALFNRGISDDLLEEIVKKPAIQILTAGRQQDQAQERNGHGVFTEVLLRGLGGDAFAGKSWLSLEELGVWMKQRVYVESNKKQIPQFGNLSGEGQFVFVKGGVDVAKGGLAPASAPVPVPGPSAALTQKQQELAALEEEARRAEEETKQAELDRQIAEKRRQIEEQKKKKLEVASLPTPSLPRQTGREITGKDGAPMVLVPEGDFLYGDDKQRKSLSAFYMDKYEVSTKLYSQFVQATGRKQPDDWSQQVALVGSGDRPVVNVTWHDADAYCRQYGKRLPTEQEWEKAARGTDGRKYPWGNDEPNGSLAKYDQDGKASWNGYTTLASIESYDAGRSPYGIYNMAGNVLEWTSSNYDDIDKDKYKVIRGGSWALTANGLRSTFRYLRSPSNWDSHLGFRCAQDAR